MSDAPDLPELVEGVLFYPVALVISATICPGLTLCIPGLVFVAALVVIPLVAMAMVAAVVAAVVAAPVLVMRAIRGRVALKSRVAVGEAAPTAIA